MNVNVNDFTKWAPIRELCTLGNYVQMLTLRSSVWDISQLRGISCLAFSVNGSPSNYSTSCSLFIVWLLRAPSSREASFTSPQIECLHKDKEVLFGQNLTSERGSHRTGRNWKEKSWQSCWVKGVRLRSHWFLLVSPSLSVPTDTHLPSLFKLP